MDKEYLTIKEYAEIKGISAQAVYKKLNGTLQPFVELVEGRKMLKRSVLEDDDSTPSLKNFQPFSTDGSTVEKGGCPSSSTQDEITRINRRNEELIDDLRNEIKSKDEQIKQMNGKLVSLFETNQRLLENNQKLQLNYQMLLGTTETITDEVADDEGALARAHAKDENEEPQQKKSWFSRLFNR